jgi:hypothetical protein
MLKILFLISSFSQDSPYLGWNLLAVAGVALENNNRWRIVSAGEMVALENGRR